jgi:hypothetical protein
VATVYGSPIIVARPAGQGRCDALLDGRVLVARTRQPLLDGARALVAEGVDPGARLVMRHEGSATDALIARSVGEAAALTVEDGERGIHFRRWKPFQASDVQAPVASDAAPLLGQPPAAKTHRPRHPRNKR